MRGGGIDIGMDVAADPFEQLDRRMRARAGEDAAGAGDTLEEYVKFSTGRNDLQKWVEGHRILYGNAFSYENASFQMQLGARDRQLERAPRPYLKQYINDACRDKTVIKCRQSEFTENELNENIWFAVTIPHVRVRHLFPTDGLANKMSREKIGPAMEKSPSIVKLMRKPFNITSKEFKNGSFYTIDGSWADHGGRGPSSDKITFDEYETQNPRIEEIYSESLSHSAIGRKSRISTPMFPNGGIDMMFQKGCQYSWIVVCRKCRKAQTMDFPDNIMNYFEAEGSELETEAYLRKLNRVYIGCKHCGAYIHRDGEHYLKTSRWVPKRKHLVRERASYRVTYMMLPWKTGKEVTSKYHSFRFKHQFWNEVMGFAFTDPTATITRDVFERCVDNQVRNAWRTLAQSRNISIGVDWGMVSWVVVRANGFAPNPRDPRIIYVERIDEKTLKDRGYNGAQTDHAKRVADIMVYFRGKVLVNDANGIGVDRNAYLVRRFPTRAWGCFYDTDEVQKMKRKERLIKPQFVQKPRTVRVSRVGTFKLLVAEYEEERCRIPALDPDMEEFVQHHANLVIQMYADEKTGDLYEVVGKTGPDHYAHADNYSKIGFDFLVNVVRDTTIGLVNVKQAGVPIETYVNPDYD